MDPSIEAKDIEIPDREEASPKIIIVSDQSQDQELTKLKFLSRNATATKSETRHHLIMDDLSDPDGNPKTTP